MAQTTQLPNNKLQVIHHIVKSRFSKRSERLKQVSQHARWAHNDTCLCIRICLHVCALGGFWRALKNRDLSVTLAHASWSFVLWLSGTKTTTNSCCVHGSIGASSLTDTTTMAPYALDRPSPMLACPRHGLFGMIHFFCRDGPDKTRALESRMAWPGWDAELWSELVV